MIIIQRKDNILFEKQTPNIKEENKDKLEDNEEEKDKKEKEDEENHEEEE